MTRVVNSRIRLLLLVIVVVFGALLAREAWLATVRAAPLAAMAQAQTKAVVALPAGRGTIFDTVGTPLAIGEQATTIAADPRQVRNPRREAVIAAGVLGIDPNKLFRALSNGGPRPSIFRTWPAKIFDAPDGESVGWDPVAVGLVEPDEAYKGKRVHKIHVAKNGDLFLETHGFRPGVISGVLLDSSTPTKLGGTGVTFDWERVQPWAGIINSISKLIVAGGLHPGNVQNAIHILHPWGVDVSTGVESEPGKKDPKKVRAFIQAVRSMEENN